MWIRIKEIEQSLRLVDQILDGLPAGSVWIELPAGAGEGHALVESFRGDVFAWMRIDGGRVARGHLRDPSWFQWPLLEAAIEGNIVADFPLCNKSFNCSYSDHDLRSSMLRTLLQGLRAPVTEPVPAVDPELSALAAQLDAIVRRRLGRSLSIREVDAGSCNGCELEIHAINNAFYDMERFGLRFVALSRHADVLLVTGPVTRNMREALKRTFAATPAPKWVVAAGDCAAGCGVFADSAACVGAVAKVMPVDLVIRGCPPSPNQLLGGLLALLGTG